MGKDYSAIKQCVFRIFDYFPGPTLFSRNTKCESVTIKEYNPNEPGVLNGRCMGLPFNEEESDCILLPVPWDVTTSYAEGTSSAPENILQASAQLDLCDISFPETWKRGIYMVPPD